MSDNRISQSPWSLGSEHVWAAWRGRGCRERVVGPGPQRADPAGEVAGVPVRSRGGEHSHPPVTAARTSDMVADPHGRTECWAEIRLEGCFPILGPAAHVSSVADAAIILRPLCRCRVCVYAPVKAACHPAVPGHSSASGLGPRLAGALGACTRSPANSATTQWATSASDSERTRGQLSTASGPGLGPSLHPKSLLGL